MNDRGLGKLDTTPPVPPKGRQYLFTIGIDAYRYSPPLYNCVRDLKAIIELLQRDYQFDAEHTFRLYNEAATEKNIFDTFKQLVHTITCESREFCLMAIGPVPVNESNLPVIEVTVMDKNYKRASLKLLVR
jgi:hypothetical protein